LILFSILKERPSQKELAKKLKEARESALAGRIMIVDQEVIAADALELGYLVEDITGVVAGALEEIKPSDYAGQRPPQRSYERAILGLELSAFRWKSRLMGAEVYLKFAVKENLLWLVSFHIHREG
jgi:hypothetical protein